MSATATRVCAGCGTPISTVGGRKWCSNRCRKASYGDPCVDCGGRTSYGAESARVPEPRCGPCAVARRRHWTPERITAAICVWADLYGEPPAQTDWNPYAARARFGDEERARRFESAAGAWPSFTTVIEVFGSWNAAIAAAGFKPRVANGGGGNVQRRRDARVAA